MFFVDSVSFEGALEKQGKLQKWSWKKYWFVLEDDQLCYYKDQKRSSSQGLINLAQAQSVTICNTANRGFPLEIVTPSRCHILSAETSELREKWIKRLQCAMLLRRRRSSVMNRPSCNSISDDEMPDDLAELDAMLQACRVSEVLNRKSAPPQVSGSSPKAREKPSKTPRSKSELDIEVIMRHKSVESTERDASLVSVSKDVPNGRAVSHTEDVCEYAASTTEKSSYDLEEISQMNFSFDEIPPLPHPRLELTWGSPCDQIRTFIANNRGPREVFAPPRKSERGGKAIRKLKEFLQSLE